MANDQTGRNRKWKMAASKLHIGLYISQLIHKITTNFQRLHLCCRGPTTQLELCDYCATSGHFTYFRFGSRHLGFSASGLSGRFGQSADDLLEPDNMWVAVGISSVYVYKRMPRYTLFQTYFRLVSPSVICHSP